MMLLILAVCALGQLSSVQIATAALQNALLLKEKVPLTLDFCKGLGYNDTSKINFMKQSQTDAKNDRLYKAWVVLDGMGCSDLIKPLTCSVYAPAYLDGYKTSLPPCRSFCQTAEEQCSKFLPFMRKLFTGVEFYCEYFKDASDQHRCIDYTFNKEESKFVLTVRGSDWKTPPSLISAQLAPAPSKNVLLLQEKVPVALDFCKGIGYKETSKINFMKQSQAEAKNDALYKAWILLDNFGCSQLLKPLTCSVYAPAYLDGYKTSLPPCRSLCQTAEKQCSKFTPFMSKMFNKVEFYCEYFEEPSDQHGCIDYTFNEEQAKFVMSVKGSPKLRTSDWKTPPTYTSDQLAAVPLQNVLLLKEKVPLTLDFCKGLGYEDTSQVNFMKQSQTEAKNDRLYKAWVVLDSMGCSDLIKPLTCSVYAPAYLDVYKTSLPPCRSLCQTAEKQCSKFLPFMRKLFTKVEFYCEYFEGPSDHHGCIDYTFNKEQAKFVMSVKGNPEMRSSDWIIPTK